MSTLTRVSRLLQPNRASSIDASNGRLNPSAVEPSLGVAQANALKLNALLTNYGTVEFTKPGDYYFGSLVTIPSNTRLLIAPGVTLWRHSGYSGTVSGLGHLFGFAETTQTTDVYIGGGGAIGRQVASAVSDGMHTMRFVNYDRFLMEDIVVKDTAETTKGKFAILSSRGNNGTFRRLGFIGAIAANLGLSSDGVHLTGQHTNMLIEECYGACNDNPIAAMVNDYAAVMDAEVVAGSIDGLIIRNNRFTSASEHVRITGNLVLSATAGAISSTVAADADITGVTYNHLNNTLAKTNICDSLTVFGDGHYLVVKGGTGVTDLGGTAASGSAPLYVRVRRKIDANTIEIETRLVAGSSTTADVTILNAYYTAAHTIKNVTIEGQRGSVKANNNGVTLLDDTSAAPNTLNSVPMDNITFRDISITVPTAGYSAVRINATGIKTLNFEGVIEAREDSDQSAIGVNIDCTRNIIRQIGGRGRLIRRNAGTAGYPLSMSASAHRVDFDELLCEARGTSGGVSAINIAGSSSYHPVIDVFSARNAECIALSPSMTRSVVQTNNSTVPWVKMFKFDRVYGEGLDYIFRGSAAASLANCRTIIHVRDLMVVGALGTIVSGQNDVFYDNLYRDLTTGTYQETASANCATLQKSGSLQFVLLESDFTTAGTSQTINLRTGLARYDDDRLLPRGATITGVKVDVVTPFTGGGISAANINVGTSGSTSKFISAQNVFTGATTPTFTPATWAPESLTATTDLSITLNTVSANVVAATAGEVRVTFYWEQ